MPAQLSALLLTLLAYPGTARASDHALEATYQDRGLVRSATTQVAGLDAPLHYLETGPKASQKLVLFLHGAAFSARTWQLTGVLDAVGAAGFRAIAIDLPGYGDFRRKQAPADRRVLVSHFLDALGWTAARQVVVVAASMGGSFGLPFVLTEPERVAGYVTAAALLDLETVAGCKLRPCSATPTLLVWGELDSPSGKTAATTESLFGVHAQKIVYPNAPHPCYLKYPEAFTYQLLEFLGVGSPAADAHAAQRAAVSARTFPQPAIEVRAKW